MTADTDKTSPALAHGFADYGPDANTAFRTCLAAMSRPGTIRALGTDLAPPAPLFATTAAVLLTVADFETRVWLDEPLARHEDVSTFIRFHTGAAIAEDRLSSTFAVVSDVASMPAINSFALGTADYPDRSTTLIIQVDALGNSGAVFCGPGILDEVQFSVAPEPRDFAAQLKRNRAQFPCGADLIFVTKTHVAALPRSVKLVAEG